MLFFGEGGAVAKRDAFRWYLLAAEQGDDAYAMYSAGFCLVHGEGTNADPAAGLRWLREPAGRGDANAQFELGCACLQGRGMTRDANQGAAWLESAAALGHAEARKLMRTR